jgi:large subunit ribosomal protein L1
MVIGKFAVGVVPRSETERMALKSVTYRKRLEVGGDVSTEMAVDQAIERIKKMADVRVDRTYKNGRSRKKFDQTVVLVVRLGIDPRKADQMLRGSISLPKGTGQTQRVIAFCDEAMAEKAKAAGAIEAGGDELIEKITGGWMDFDVAIAHPQMMGKVGKLGKTLGPQGKMPSPKAGTVTADIENAVREYAAGKLEYRNDAGGNIHLKVGKISFSTADLEANIQAFLEHLRRIKPSSAKGAYFRSVYVSAQQTPSVRLAVA